MSSVLCFLTRVVNGLVSALFYFFWLWQWSMSCFLPWKMETVKTGSNAETLCPPLSLDRALSLGNRRQRAQDDHHCVGGEPHTVFSRVLAPVNSPVNYRDLSGHIRSSLCLTAGYGKVSSLRDNLTSGPSSWNTAFNSFCPHQRSQVQGIGAVKPLREQDWGTTCVLWEGGGCRLSLLEW